MSALLKNNAYHILGLDTSASERELIKRSKEIVNRIKADDNPNYELDIRLFKAFRTEESVSDAIRRLQTPKKRIVEYFFWFQIADEVDEKVLELFKNNELSKATHIWKHAAEGSGTKAFFYKKNLAILYCLLLSAADNQDYLKESLNIWKELVESEKFWATFTKVYRLHDEQTSSDDIVSELKKHVVEYLSDIYTELHHIRNNNEYVNEFHRTFAAKGERIEKTVLAPAYQIINEAVKALENLKVSADGKFDKDEATAIKTLVSKIQVELNKLMDMGLYEDSQTKIMRDRSANALRTVSIDIHNHLDELEKSRGLLQVAIELAGTESLKSKLADELKQIDNNIRLDVENSVAIDVPGIFGTGSILFKNNFVEYQKTKLLFKDITTIYYHARSKSVNGIPVSQNFSFMLGTPSDSISIALGTSLHIGKKPLRDSWGKMIHLAESLIVPNIIKNVVERIFDRAEPISIGQIEFSKQGYSRTKLKFFGPNEKQTVLWADKIWIPEFRAGNVILWKDQNGKGLKFDTVEMSVPNAVIIPALIKACLNRR